MLELLKSLVFAVIMVPVVMAVILGLIYGLGEVFNLFSGVGHKITDFPAPGLTGRRAISLLYHFPSFYCPVSL